MLKLLGKQRKDNILMKKILSVQIEKEKVERGLTLRNTKNRHREWVSWSAR